MRITGTGSATEELITPRECSLAVALPLRREEFMHDLAANASAGYASGFAQNGRDGLAAETVWELFEPWARLANGVIAEAEGHHVTVVRSATLAEFSSLLRRFPATTLFAHWHTPRFTEEQIVAPEAIRKAMSVTESPLFQRVQEIASLLDAPPQFPSDSSPGAIADFLNRLIEPAPCSEEAKPGCVTRKQVEWHERRMLLDSAFLAAFRGGAGVDFADGWRSIEAIVAAVPNDYSGTLDLTVCNSNVLAERIRGSFRKSVVIANERTTTTGFRFGIYVEIIKILSRKAGNYEKISLKLRDQLFRHNL